MGRAGLGKSALTLIIIVLLAGAYTNATDYGTGGNDSLDSGGMLDSALQDELFGWIPADTQTEIVLAPDSAPEPLSFLSISPEDNLTFARTLLELNLTDANYSEQYLNITLNISMNETSGTIFGESGNGTISAPEAPSSFEFYYFPEQPAPSESQTPPTVSNPSAPIVEISSPKNQSYENATILVQIDSTAANTWFSPYPPNDESHAPLFRTPPISEYYDFPLGANTLYAWATDEEGNMGVASVSFTVQPAPQGDYFAFIITGNESAISFNVSNENDGNAPEIAGGYSPAAPASGDNGSPQQLIGQSGLPAGALYINVADYSDSEIKIDETAIHLPEENPLIGILNETRITIPCEPPAAGRKNESAPGTITGTPTAPETATGTSITNPCEEPPVETIIPSLSVLSPLPETYQNGSILIDINTSGNYTWIEEVFPTGEREKPLYREGPVYEYYAFPEGVHTLFIYASDISGNTNATNVTFIVKEPKPENENATIFPFQNETALPPGETGTIANETQNGTIIPSNATETPAPLILPGAFLEPLSDLSVLTLRNAQLTFEEGKTRPALEFPSPQSESELHYAMLGDARQYDFGKNDFSISAWILTQSDSEGTLLEHASGKTNSGYGIILNPGGTLRFFTSENFSSAYSSSLDSLNDGSWHHVAAVRDSYGLSIYADGVLAAYSASAPQDISNPGPLSLGASMADFEISKIPRSQFAGAMKQIRVRGWALTPIGIYREMKEPDWIGEGIPQNGTVIGNEINETQNATVIELNETETQNGTEIELANETGYIIEDSYNGKSTLAFANGRTLEISESALAMLEANLTLRLLVLSLSPLPLPEGAGLLKEHGNGKIRVLMANRSSLRALSDAGADEIYEDTQMQASLSDTVPLIGASLAQSELGITGDGISVCLLDTGTDFSLPELGGMAVSGHDFVNNDEDSTDDNGHGTRMAQVIHAVAPGAAILSVKVLGGQGTGYSSDIIAGMDYCRERASGEPIKIISMSFGGGSFGGYCDSADPVARAAGMAYQSGLFMVAASGNNGSSLITSPACAEGAVAVSSTSKQDEVSPFSNMNGMVDLLAPGQSVVVGGTAYSGTSISAAHVSGAAALLLQSNSSLSASEAESLFRETGMPIEFDGSNYTRINAYNAITGNFTGAPTNQSVNQTNQTGEGNESFGILDFTVSNARTSPNGTQVASGVSWVAGYCNFTSDFSTSVGYNFTWWLNGAVNSSGVYSLLSRSTMLGTGRIFAYEAGFTNPSNANDSNYATKATYTEFSNASMYWNYTNPSNSTNQTIWQTKHGTASTANDTLPSSCAAQPTVQLKITANNSNTSSQTPATAYSPNATTLTNGVAPAGYTAQFTDPANAKLNDANYATVTLDDSQYSAYIYGVGNGFGIPAGATITGVQITSIAKAANANRGSAYDVRIYNNSAICGNNMADTTAFGTGDTTVVHGSSTSTSGCALSASDVNNANFGFAFSVIKYSSAGGGMLISVNYVNMTVYYNTTSTTNYSQSSKFCFNGAEWQPVGTNSTATDSFDASDIYDQDIFFNTSSGGNASGLEVMVNNLTTTFAAGQNWTLTCTGYDGQQALATNSSELNLTGAPGITVTPLEQIATISIANLSNSTIRTWRVNTSGTGTWTVSWTNFTDTWANVNQTTISGTDLDINVSATITVTKNETANHTFNFQFNSTTSGANNETANITTSIITFPHVKPNEQNNTVLVNAGSYNDSTSFNFNITGCPGACNYTVYWTNTTYTYADINNTFAGFVTNGNYSLRVNISAALQEPNNQTIVFWLNSTNNSATNVTFNVSTFITPVPAGLTVTPLTQTATISIANLSNSTIRTWRVNTSGSSTWAVSWTNYTDTWANVNQTVITGAFIDINISATITVTKNETQNRTFRFDFNSSTAPTTNQTAVINTSIIYFPHARVTPENQSISVTYDSFNTTSFSFNVTGCPGGGCNYSVYWANFTYTNATINSTFASPVQSGVYSLLVNVTVNASETEGRTLVFWLNGTDNAATNITFNVSVTPAASGPVPPTQGTPILNSTYGTNTTNENLTCYNQSTSDPNGDLVSNNFDFRVNGTSIALLNMPFNTNVTSLSVGAVSDYSTNAKNGTLGGTDSTRAPNWTATGIVGGAYNFTGGSEDVIRIDGSEGFDGWSEFTLQAWVRPTRSGDRGMGILMKRDSATVGSFQLGFDGASAQAGKIYCGISNETAYHEAPASDARNPVLGPNAWHLVTCTYKNGIGLKLYINSTLTSENTTGLTGTTRDSASAVLIGARNNSGPLERGFNGTIDEVRIYNRAISEYQINKTYALGYNTLVSQQLYNYTNYTCMVTPSDGIYDGTNLTSNIVVVQPIPQLAVSFASPVNNTQYNETSILINISSTAAQFVWFWNGTANESYAAPLYRNFSLGIWNLTAYANNSTGAEVSSYVNFSVANPPLNVTITSPINNTLYNATPQLITITNSSAQFVWYSLDGGPNESYSGPFYRSFYGQNHSIIAYANNSTGGEVSYLINFTRPFYDDVMFNSTFQTANLYYLEFVSGDSSGNRVYNGTLNYSQTYATSSAYHHWFFYKMTNASGKNVKLNLTGLAPNDFSPASTLHWEYVIPRYSYDFGQGNVDPNAADWRAGNWSSIFRDSIKLSATTYWFSYNLSATSNTAWLAMLPPYTIERRDRFMAEIASNPYVTNISTITVSEWGINQTFVEITDPAFSNSSKVRIHVNAQELSNTEVQGTWKIEGAIRALLNGSNSSRTILRNYIYRFLPIVNVDGVYYGVGRFTPLYNDTMGSHRDPNREYDNAEQQTAGVLDIINKSYLEEKEFFNSSGAGYPSKNASFNWHGSINGESGFSVPPGVNYHLHDGLNDARLIAMWNNYTYWGWEDTVDTTGAETTLGHSQNVRTGLGVHPSFNVEEDGGNVSSTYAYNETDFMRHGEGHIAALDGFFQERGNGVADIVKPNVSLISPINQTSTTNSTVYFACRATDDRSIKNVSLYVWNSTALWQTNSTNNPSGLNGTFNFTASGFTAGDYLWNCLAYDNESNWNWSKTNNSLTITAAAGDSTAPSVTLWQPPDGNTTSNTSLTFQCNVTDNVNVSNVTLYLWNSTGGLFLNNSTQNPSGLNGTFNFTASNFANGTYNWSCLAYDNSSNAGWAAANFTLNIDLDDHVAPSVTLWLPVNNTNTSNTSITFQCNVTDNGILRNVTLYIWNSTALWLTNATQNISGLGNATFNLTASNFVNGTHKWNCLAFDNNSNSAWASGGNFTLNMNYDDVVFNSTFQSGNLLNISFFSGDYTGARYYTANTNYSRLNFTEYHWWFFFKMQNANGKNIKINLTNLSTGGDFDSPDPRWPNVRPRFSYDYGAGNVDPNAADWSEGNWSWVQPASITYGSSSSPWFSFNLTATQDTVWVAPNVPYTVLRRDLYLATKTGSPYIGLYNITMAPWGQNITRADITDFAYSNASKKRIYIVGQQHANEEAQGSWAIEGAIDFLLNTTNDTAATLRRNYIFRFIPVFNVDGTYAGIGRFTPIYNNSVGQYDTNRQWDEANNSIAGVYQPVNITFYDIGNFSPNSTLDWHGSINGENGFSIPPGWNYFLTDRSYDTAQISFLNNISNRWEYIWSDHSNPTNAQSLPVNARDKWGSHPSDTFEWTVSNVTPTMLPNNTDWYRHGKNHILGIHDWYNSTANAIDTTNPELKIVAPSTAAGNYSRNYIEVNATATDNQVLRNITITLYNSDGSLNSSSTSTSSPLFANFTSLADGIYYYNATAYDYVGNSNNTTAVQVILDNTAPSVGNTSVNTTSVGLDAPICINATATDALSGISTAWAMVVFPNGTEINYTMSDTGCNAGSAGDGWFGVSINSGTTAGNLTVNTTFANNTVGLAAGQSPYPNLVVAVAGIMVDTSIDASSISFGSVDPNSVANPATSNITLTNTPNSNVPIDIYLNNSNLTNSSNIIPYTNMSLWTVNNAAYRAYFNSSTYLNGTAANTGFVEDLAVNTNASFFFWQDVPPGQVAAVYTGAVTIHSIANNTAP